MPIPFPGHYCRFFSVGRCLRAEMLNPGLDARLRCARLQALVLSWDAFLDRAEAFGLSEDATARIWNGRRHPALEARALCPAAEAAGIPQPGRKSSPPAPAFSEDSPEKPPSSGDPDCRYLRDGACLLAMPSCTGVCRDFERPR